MQPWLHTLCDSCHVQLHLQWAGQGSNDKISIKVILSQYVHISQFLLQILRGVRKTCVCVCTEYCGWEHGLKPGTLLACLFKDGVHWESYLIMLSLNFLFCNMGVRVGPTSLKCYVNWHNIHCLAQCLAYRAQQLALYYCLQLICLTWKGGNKERFST